MSEIPPLDVATATKQLSERIFKLERVVLLLLEAHPKLSDQAVEILHDIKRPRFLDPAGDGNTYIIG